MPKESEQYCLSCVSSDPVCTQPARWFYPAEYRDVIVLSDGSKWMMVTEHKSEFEPGDRVFVSRYRDDYYIVNIDQNSVLSKGTSFFKTCTTAYVSLRVRPYLPEETTEE
jgi:hypothetical protein